MSTRRNRTRALVPSTEGLETRQLLSKTITGQDSDGDHWVLKLIGAGDLRVTKQTDSSGNIQSLQTASQIDTIEIAGANPVSTRLVGQVRRGASGDGKVFFNSMTEIGGRSEGTGGTNGILAIDMPAFWLGYTGSTAVSAATEPSIDIPDGVITIRFGGSDTTFTPPGGTALNTNGTADTFNVNLGLPKTQGTSVIVDSVISSGQAGTTSTTGTTGNPTQDSVIFTVSGRLNEFQANSIQGNTAFPTSGFRGGGGVLVVSQSDPLTAITGQIGFVRVGGNATNFSVQTNDKISNFYVGGETNNVQLLAPNGSRAIAFGKGMDTVTILTHYIDSLQANRGALNSDVTIDRNVGRITIGGDVVNTNIMSGYQQNLAGVFSTQSAPTSTPTAQDGGALTNLLIAGSVTNSVFSASAQPQFDVHGPNDLLLPHGHITAKIGGKIDNSTATPDSPTQALYSKFTKLDRGAVIPPSIPELPLPNQGTPPHGPRVVQHLQPTQDLPTNLFPKGSTATASRVKTASTPKGPLKKN